MSGKFHCRGIPGTMQVEMEVISVKAAWVNVDRALRPEAAGVAEWDQLSRQTAAWRPVDPAAAPFRPCRVYQCQYKRSVAPFVLAPLLFPEGSPLGVDGEKRNSSERRPGATQADSVPAPLSGKVATPLNKQQGVLEAAGSGPSGGSDQDRLDVASTAKPGSSMGAAALNRAGPCTPARAAAGGSRPRDDDGDVIDLQDDDAPAVSPAPAGENGQSAPWTGLHRQQQDEAVVMSLVSDEEEEGLLHQTACTRHLDTRATCTPKGEAAGHLSLSSPALPSPAAQEAKNASAAAVRLEADAEAAQRILAGRPGKDRHAGMTGPCSSRQGNEPAGPATSAAAGSQAPGAESVAKQAAAEQLEPPLKKRKTGAPPAGVSGEAALQAVQDQNVDVRVQRQLQMPVVKQARQCVAAANGSAPKGNTQAATPLPHAEPARGLQQEDTVWDCTSGHLQDGQPDQAWGSAKQEGPSQPAPQTGDPALPKQEGFSLSQFWERNRALRAPQQEGAAYEAGQRQAKGKQKVQEGHLKHGGDDDDDLFSLDLSGAGIRSKYCQKPGALES